MNVALKGVPVAAPPGLLLVDDDWLYAKWADGGWVARLAAEAGPLRAPSSMAEAASTASATASAPAGP